MKIFNILQIVIIEKKNTGIKIIIDSLLWENEKY